jgi:prepilin-type N-terminal cleavage/methylation domain-containing protein
MIRTIQQLQLESRQSGFTIVELMIVVIVIAIVATITIVVFNGINIRAENTKTLAAVDLYAKALQMYKANTGDYPLAGAGFQFGCIAESGTCAMVGGANGADCASIGASGVSNTLNTAMKTVIASIPSASSQTLQCETKTVRGALYIMYGNYFGPDIRNGYIIYYLNGDQACNTPAGSSLVSPNGRIYYSTGTTRCYIQFDA